jgi:hypothetical protein
MSNVSPETLIARFTEVIDTDGEALNTGSDIPLTVRETPGGFQHSLDEAFEAAQSIYGYAGLDVTQVDDSGLDDEAAQRLSGIYELMNLHDLQPDVVVTRAGVDLRTLQDGWFTLVQKIHEPVIMSGDMGLMYSESIKKYWEQLRLSADAGWTVGVISAAPEAPLRDVSYDLSRIQDKMSAQEIQAVIASYPGVAEYLSLQAGRYLAGRPPIDVDGSTILLHTIDEDSKAPIANGLPEIDGAAVTCTLPDVQHPSFGVRLSFREELPVAT